MAAGHPLDLLDGFAPALDGLGTPEFDAALLGGLARIAAVDHLTMFGYTAAAGLKLLGIASRSDAALNRSLTRDYVDDLHRLDPNFAELARPGASRRIIVKRFDPDALATASYRQRFFSSAGLVDKISWIWRTPGMAFYINLYRDTQNGRFSAADAARLGAAAPFAARLVRRHADHVAFAGSLDAADPRTITETLVTLAGPELTSRERAVCVRILLGLSADGIALDLGIGRASVITFRRRAYAKLGISTQAELFAAVLRALPAAAQADRSLTRSLPSNSPRPTTS